MLTNKKVIFIFILINHLISSKDIAPHKIKMYALYTPSHSILVDKYFIPSIKDDFDLKITLCDQKCPTAKFNSKGWNMTMQDKVQVIIDAIKENFGKIFIFSDVDIIFLQPVEDTIKKLMSQNDFIIQRSSIKTNNACTGFFAMRGNKDTLGLWVSIKEFMLNHPKLSEENVLNIFISEKKLKNIKWNYLPVEFYNGGMLTNKVWSPGQNLIIPDNILLHHANWTVGIENKIAQFDYVIKNRKK